MINLENLKKDSIYFKLFEQYGGDYIINAGYFENETQDNCFSDDELIDSLKFLCTSLPKKSEIRDNSIILLNTGCYNPIHNGHIKMMEAAKKRMEKNNYHVLQGYFAPDADSYVKTKSKDYLNINQRIQAINNKIVDKDWLSVEPWAGTFLGKDVNFTTIYRRLELYVEKYLGVKVPIYYVCGSDRAGFSYTFEDKTIVVDRQNTDLKEIIGVTHPKAHKCSSKSYSYESSTEIRKNWGESPLVKKNLSLRVNKKSSQRTIGILSSCFNRVYYNKINDQRKEFKKIESETISLDSILSNKYKLEISRFYSLGGTKFISHQNRVGSKSIKKQLKKIPKDKKLIIFDDDTFSGGTFKFANKLLIKHNIIGEIALIKSDIINNEILDLRDFSFGKNSGLSIETPTGQKFRVPYIYPFVDPYIRASIITPVDFSKKMWLMNYYFFCENNCTVGSSTKFDCFKYIGFENGTLMTDVCKFFIKNLLIK